MSELVYDFCKFEPWNDPYCNLNNSIPCYANCWDCEYLWECQHPTEHVEMAEVFINDD